LTEECIRKTQWKSIINPGVPSKPEHCFIMQKAKDKCWVPGPGTHVKAVDGNVGCAKVLGKTKIYNKKGAQW
jgi:hypothetical protein